MPRLSSDRDRGAVSVVVALLMVALLGFAAISIDVAALWSARQQLQTGADAAALAIAQDCARGSCGDTSATAQRFAELNKNDGDVTGRVLELAPTSGTVRVGTASTQEHWFAPVLGVDASDVAAEATARWGAPTGGTAILPLAFSWCEWQAQTGGGLPSGTTERTIFFTKSSGTSCTGPSNNMVPGGFGWLAINAGTCQTRSTIGTTIYTDPGENVPSGCTTADFAAVQNQVVLLPLYDLAGSSGTNAWYRLYGYAAFRVTGYHFVGQFSWSAEGSCKGSVRCVQGYFVQFVSLDDRFTYGVGAPRLGASVVSLTG